MQISKLSSGKIKNFRIQLRTQLASKQKQKNRSHSQQIKENIDKFSIKKGDFCQNKSNEKKPKRSLSIINLLNHPKVTQNNRDHTKYNQNNKKQPLTLTSKQKILTISNNKTEQKIKIQSQNTDTKLSIKNKFSVNQCENQKQNINQNDILNENIIGICQNNMNLINRKKNGKLSLSEKNLHEDKNDKIQDKKIQEIQLNQQIENSSQSLQNQIEKQRINNLTWQNQFQNIFFKQSQIKNQFSINVKPQPQMISIGIQASNFSNQDKYFLQYARFRQLKVKHYEQVQQKQQKIKELIEESLKFSNHYRLMSESLNEPPFTDRQKRIYWLGKELQDAEIKVKQAISHVHEVQKESEIYLQRNTPELQHKKDEIFESVINSIRNLLLSKENAKKRQQERNEQHKDSEQIKRQKAQCEILTQVLNQFRYLKHLDANEYSKIIQIINQYQQEVKEFEKTYMEWSGLFYETRVLVYNFMRQIQKIPEIMIELFGFKSKQEDDKIITAQNQFDQYMSEKCEKCYHTNKKVKFLQAANQQIKPVLKSLEWLIRDMSKKRTCISII